MFERPDLMPTPAPRIDQHDPARARAHRSGPGAAGQGALRLQRQPGRGRARTRSLVLRGLAREDLFTVVHEQVTDGHRRLRGLRAPRDHLDGAQRSLRSYGQFYLQLARPVMPPQGEARSNWQVCGMLARALGAAEAHYANTPDDPDPRGSGPRQRDGAWHHLRATLRRALGAPQSAEALSAVRPRGADAVGQGRAVLGADGRPRAAGVADLDTADRGAGRRRARHVAIRCSASCRPTASS